MKNVLTFTYVNSLHLVIAGLCYLWGILTNKRVKLLINILRLRYISDIFKLSCMKIVAFSFKFNWDLLTMGQLTS